MLSVSCLLPSYIDHKTMFKSPQNICNICGKPALNEFGCTGFLHVSIMSYLHPLSCVLIPVHTGSTSGRGTIDNQPFRNVSHVEHMFGIQPGPSSLQNVVEVFRTLDKILMY